MEAILKYEKPLFLIAGLFILVSIMAIYFKAQNATDAYLSAWSFWFQFPMGAMAITMLNDLTGGVWGLDARPVLKSMMKCLGLSSLLFVPLLFNLQQFFPWLQNNLLIAQNDTLKFKQPFYDISFFTLRAVFYFFLFLLMARHASHKKRGRYLSAWGLFLYVFTMSFASMDWFMSREPEWYSTIYSLIWIMSQVCSAFAVILAVKHPLFHLQPQSPKQKEINNDHGTIFFVFTVIWAYLSFMQFLIIWSANLPKELIWYQLRMNAGWQFMILFIMGGALFIPFFLLINKRFKTNPKSLSRLALFVLLFRFLDVLWIILPASREHLQFSHWDIISFIGIGGLVTVVFLKELKKEISFLDVI